MEEKCMPFDDTIIQYIKKTIFFKINVEAKE